MITFLFVAYIELFLRQRPVENHVKIVCRVVVFAGNSKVEKPV